MTDKNPEATPCEELVSLVEQLLTEGQFFISTIEFDSYRDFDAEKWKAKVEVCLKQHRENELT